MSSVQPPRYFFIIGAMKAGTTSLFKYLAGHPALYPSPRKEPRVFRDPRPPDALRAELSALFAGRNGQPWCFEASTAYTKFPHYPGVPQRLQQVVPDARFVYLVRNPVERVWSQYVHNLAHGREKRPFALTLKKRPEYLNISRYHLQLQQYAAVFPRNRLHVVIFEDMIKDPAAVVQSVCGFLGIDTSYRPAADDVVFNASSEKVTAPAALRLARNLGVEEAIPWRVRRWLTQGGAPLPSKTTALTADVRGQIVDSLRPDTEAFFNWFERRIAAWKDFA